jgi:hypothetical protein
MERPKAVLRGPFGGGSFKGQLPDWLFAQEVGPEDALLAGRTGRGSSPRARTGGPEQPRDPGIPGSGSSCARNFATSCSGWRVSC